MPNRTQRKALATATTYYRITPLFRRPEGDLEECVTSSIVDGALDECMVVRVPSTTTFSQAQEIEKKLTEKLSRPCIVTTRNIEFCKVEVVPAKEIAHLLKAASKPTEEEKRDRLHRLAGLLPKELHAPPADTGAP